MSTDRQAQGTADPITVTEELRPEHFCDESETTYLEATHEIRFVADYERPDEDEPELDPFTAFDDLGEPIYDTMPLEQWAEEQASARVSKHVYSVAQTRLDADTEDTPYTGDLMPGQWWPSATTDTETGADLESRPVGAPAWKLTTYVNEESGRTLNPPVAFEDLVAATPATATITLTFAGQEHTTTFPIGVVEETKELPAQVAERLPEEEPDVGGEYESIADANEVLPFELRGPTCLPDGYRLIQVAVHEPSWFTGYSSVLVYDSDRGNDDRDLTITARSADDPDTPGHPYGIDCEVMVNERPGTYARTDHEVVGPLPPGVSDPTELQDGVLEFIDSADTYYYMIGPFEKDELIRIAASIEEDSSAVGSTD